MKTTTTTATRLACLLATMTVVAGFGGAAHALSAKDYRRTANSICRQGRMLRQELAQQYFGDLAEGQQPTMEELRAFVAEYRPIVQQQIDSLRALPTPSNLRPRVKVMLAAATRALTRVVGHPEILLGDTDPFAKVRTAARALGLSQCAA